MYVCMYDYFKCLNISEGLIFKILEKYFIFRIFQNIPILRISWACQLLVFFFLIFQIVSNV
jgi:hypothetical protein